MQGTETWPVVLCLLTETRAAPFSPIPTVQPPSVFPPHPLSCFLGVGGLSRGPLLLIPGLLYGLQAVSSASSKATSPPQSQTGLQGPCTTQTDILVTNIIIFNTGNLSQSRLGAFELAPPPAGIVLPQKPTWTPPGPFRSLLKWRLLLRPLPPS